MQIKQSSQHNGKYHKNHEQDLSLLKNSKEQFHGLFYSTKFVHKRHKSIQN